jgi:hypothetical protein
MNIQVELEMLVRLLFVTIVVAKLSMEEVKEVRTRGDCINLVRITSGQM